MLGVSERMTEYTVILISDPEMPGAINVTVPELPGCLTYGESREEALAKAKLLAIAKINLWNWLAITARAEDPPL